MSEKIGKILGCDRCGATVFLKWTETQEFDGGYTSVACFETAPDGWGSEIVVDKRRMLCPECHREYKAITDDFFERSKAFLNREGAKTDG